MSEAGGILGPGPGEPDTWIRFRGRAVGAIVCAGFGAYSMYWWTLAVIPSGRHLWFYAISAIAAVFLVWAISQIVLFRPVRSVPNPDFAKYRKFYARFYAIRFNVILAIEVAAIFLGGPIMGHFQRKDLIPQWIDLVVGIHFLPLGKLFKLPLYYGTAAAMVLSSLGSLLIPSGSLRLATNAGGAALALWITALVILSRNPSYLPEEIAAGPF